MAIAVVPLVAVVAGLLMWALASNPKLAEAGKILFFCGTLVLLMSLAKESWKVGEIDQSVPGDSMMCVLV